MVETDANKYCCLYHLNKTVSGNEERLHNGVKIWESLLGFMLVKSTQSLFFCKQVIGQIVNPYPCYEGVDAFCSVKSYKTLDT